MSNSPSRWPTQYREVNAIVNELLRNAQAILGPQFVGMYLYGSLALNDFSEDTSDIDFVVVTEREVSPEMLAALQAMHTRIGSLSSKWAIQLEGAYLSRQAIRRHDPAKPSYPHIDRDGSDLTVRPFESDWIIQRFVLRENGITISGPEIQQLIEPTTPEDLRAAVMDLLQMWWEPMLQNPAELQKPGYRHYAILTMCRMLYTLENGTVVSKPVAGRWAIERFDEPLKGLVTRALAWRGEGAPGSVEETQSLIRYTLQCSRHDEG